MAAMTASRNAARTPGLLERPQAGRRGAAGRGDRGPQASAAVVRSRRAGAGRTGERADGKVSAHVARAARPSTPASISASTTRNT